jgi:hypothetical protein
LLGHQGQVNRSYRYGQAFSGIIIDQSALRLPIVLIVSAVLNGLLVPFRNRLILRQPTMKVWWDGPQSCFDGAPIVFIKASRDCLTQNLQQERSGRWLPMIKVFAESEA